MGYDEDSRKNKHDNYRNGGDNFESKHQQLNNECNEYPWDIRRSTISDLKQHGRSSISSSIDISQ